jgi:hypothetical protein
MPAEEEPIVYFTWDELVTALALVHGLDANEYVTPKAKSFIYKVQAMPLSPVTVRMIFS